MKKKNELIEEEPKETSNNLYKNFLCTIYIIVESIKTKKCNMMIHSKEKHNENEPQDFAHKKGVNALMEITRNGISFGRWSRWGKQSNSGGSNTITSQTLHGQSGTKKYKIIVESEGLDV